jgi:gamma-glutamyl-gamma-aminobutyrate hydrolase PuuD
VKALPKYVHIENGPMTFEELSAKWKATLRDTTAPVPAVKLPNIIPGITAESKSEGRMKLTIDHQLLTGEEVIDLLLYGELAHIDRDKEKKLIRIRESEVASGFEIAVIGVAAKLGTLIDILRMYAEAFINQLPTETIADIEENTP